MSSASHNNGAVFFLTAILFVLLMDVGILHAVEIRLASWNMENLGDTKVANSTLVGVMVDVIGRYHAICVQEIRDADFDAFPTLMEAVNAVHHNAFSYVWGSRQVLLVERSSLRFSLPCSLSSPYILVYCESRTLSPYTSCFFSSSSDLARQGETSRQEQFACIYRTDFLEVRH